MSNSVDPDEMAHYELSHLDIRCLQKPITAEYLWDHENLFETAVVRAPEGYY